MAKLPDLVSGIVEDAIGVASIESGVPIPGGATAGAIAAGAVSRFRQRRYQTMRDLILEELRLGHVDASEPASEDDAIAITLRVMRAAHEGAARVNLRLLAKLFAGQAQRGTLVADEFLPLADILESLSREEIVAIATLYANTRAWRERNTVTDDWTKLPPSLKDSINEGMLYTPSRRTEKSPPDPYVDTVGQLVPSIFASNERLKAVFNRAQRSGLVRSSAEGYRTTPLMNDVAQLADFRDALRREGIQV